MTVTLATKIRTWYVEAYPSDNVGREINPDVTFRDMFDALDSYQDIYKLLGCGDNVIRERCFEELSQVIGTSYDYIYDQWLLAADRKAASARPCAVLNS